MFGSFWISDFRCWYDERRGGCGGMLDVGFRMSDFGGRDSSGSRRGLRGMLDFGFQMSDFGGRGISSSRRGLCRRRRSRIFGQLVRDEPGSLQTLQFTLRSGVRALEAALGLPEPVQERKLALDAVQIHEDPRFPYFHANQF